MSLRSCYASAENQPATGTSALMLTCGPGAPTSPFSPWSPCESRCRADGTVNERKPHILLTLKAPTNADSLMPRGGYDSSNSYYANPGLGDTLHLAFCVRKPRKFGDYLSHLGSGRSCHSLRTGFAFLSVKRKVKYQSRSDQSRC